MHWQDIFKDVSAQREVMDLHVQCTNEGCDWVGELRHAEVGINDSSSIVDLHDKAGSE